MAGFDASPYVLFDAYGGPAYIAPARDAGTSKFDASLIIGVTADATPEVDHLATVTTAVYARPLDGLRLEFVLPVHGSYGDTSVIGPGDLRAGAAVRLADGEHATLTITPSAWLPTGLHKADFGTGTFGGGVVAAASVQALKHL